MEDSGLQACLRDHEGKTSGSRVWLLVGALLLFGLFGLWLVVFYGLLKDWWPWERFQTALTWGAGFVSGTVIPYLVSKLVSLRSNGGAR